MQRSAVESLRISFQMLTARELTGTGNTAQLLSPLKAAASERLLSASERPSLYLCFRDRTNSDSVSAWNSGALGGALLLTADSTNGGSFSAGLNAPASTTSNPAERAASIVSKALLGSCNIDMELDAWMDVMSGEGGAAESTTSKEDSPLAVCQVMGLDNGRELGPMS